MSVRDKMQPPQKWRSIEDLMQSEVTASTLHQVNWQVSENSSPSLNKAPPYPNGYNGKRVFLWVFFVTAFLSLFAYAVIVLSKRFFDNTIIKEQEKIMRLVLKANGAAMLGQYEQAKWILRTVRDLAPLSHPLKEDLVLSERYIRCANALKEIDEALKQNKPGLAKALIEQLKKYDQPSEVFAFLKKALRQRELALGEPSPKNTFSKPINPYKQAMPLSPIASELSKDNLLTSDKAWEKALTFYQQDNLDTACQLMHSITRDKNATSPWREKSHAFIQRHCS